MRVSALEAQLDEKVSREKQLLGEIKKKGDAAREIILSKEEDIKNLREKLRAVVGAAASAASATSSNHSSNGGNSDGNSNVSGSGSGGGGANVSKHVHSAGVSTPAYHNILEFSASVDPGDGAEGDRGISLRPSGLASASASVLPSSRNLFGTAGHFNTSSTAAGAMSENSAIFTAEEVRKNALFVLFDQTQYIMLVVVCLNVTNGTFNILHDTVAALGASASTFGTGWW